MTHPPENPTTPEPVQAEPVALKSCPFCGASADLFSHADYGWGPSYHVECKAEVCGCGTCHHETPDLAIAAWNQRPTPDLAERIEGLVEELRTIVQSTRHEDDALAFLTANYDAILAALKEVNSHD